MCKHLWLFLPHAAGSRNSWSMWSNSSRNQTLHCSSAGWLCGSKDRFLQQPLQSPDASFCIWLKSTRNVQILPLVAEQAFCIEVWEQNSTISRVSIHADLMQLKWELVAIYMDSLTLDGSTDIVAADIDLIKANKKETGLHIYANKCEIICQRVQPQWHHSSATSFVWYLMKQSYWEHRSLLAAKWMLP